MLKQSGQALERYLTLVRENGVITVTVRELRDKITGYSRTGSNVWRDIERELNGSGIGVFGKSPVPPHSQSEKVRLYLIDSPVGRIIDAVQSPTRTGDQRLKELSTRLQ